MKKNFFLKLPSTRSSRDVDLRSEENILRSQGRYVPPAQKLRQWIPRFIFLLIIVFIIVVWVIGVKREQAIARDAQRLADMMSVQMAFETLFRNTNQYDDAALVGCSAAGMEVSSCRVEAYLPSIASLKDPGTFQYLVTEVPKGDRFEVTFTLERAYGSLSAGEHRLNHNGIE